MNKLGLAMGVYPQRDNSLVEPMMVTRENPECRLLDCFLTVRGTIHSPLKEFYLYISVPHFIAGVLAGCVAL